MPRRRQRSLSTGRKRGISATKKVLKNESKNSKILGLAYPKYKELFDSIDRDGNGTIDPLELMYALSDINLTPYRIDLMMKEADLDCNGKIDLEEFALVMEKSKARLDDWGVASKSLWGKFKNQVKDHVDSVCEPLRDLTRKHSSGVRFRTSFNIYYLLKHLMLNKIYFIQWILDNVPFWG
jgi:hypothetical protein